MSLDRIKGSIVFICDTCDDSLDTESQDFIVAREQLRETGWKTFRNQDGDYAHKCSGCLREGL